MFLHYYRWALRRKNRTSTISIFLMSVLPALTSFYSLFFLKKIIKILTNNLSKSQDLVAQR